MVLAHVANRLSNLVSVLTVQVFKDDWTRPTAYQILGDSSIGGKLNTSSSPMKFPLTATSPEKPKQFPGTSPNQPIKSFTPLIPGSFPSFPNVGASNTMTGNVPSSFSMDSSFSARPTINRPSHKTIDPFSSPSYRSPLPDVLPTSMSIGSSYAPGKTTSPPSVGAVIGLPVNESVRLGIPNMSSQMSSGHKPS